MSSKQPYILQGYLLPLFIYNNYTLSLIKSQTFSTIILQFSKNCKPTVSLYDSR